MSKPKVDITDTSVIEDGVSILIEMEVEGRPCKIVVPVPKDGDYYSECLYNVNANTGELDLTYLNFVTCSHYC